MIGVMAVFDSRDALLVAAAAAKRERLAPVTAFAPAYDERILRACGAMESSVPWWTLAGGIAGAVVGLAFTIWTVRQWPLLVVSGKPLVAWPPFLIVAFELTILVASIGAIASFLANASRARRRVRIAYDASFSDARFGLLIACTPARANEVGVLMAQHGASAWRAV
jgi:Protein of unknown function (DUF3341)